MALRSGAGVGADVRDKPAEQNETRRMLRQSTSQPNDDDNGRLFKLVVVVVVVVGVVRDEN